MNPRVNRALLDATVFDSAAVGPMVTVIHAVGGAGEWGVKLYRVLPDGATKLDEADAVGEFRFVAEAHAPEMQLDLDLARLASEQTGKSCCTGKSGLARVNAAGSLVFYASNDAAFAATVAPLGDKPKDAAFSTVRLCENDLVVLSLLRPGRYRVTAAPGKATLGLEVRTPSESDTPTSKAISITVGSDGFEGSAKDISALPSQPVVFKCMGCTRIRVELTKPYGSNERGRHRWTRPAAVPPTKKG